MSLPELYEFHGDWTSYVEELYDIYLDEVANGGLRFNDLPLQTRYRPETDGKGYGFWHVISNGKEEEERDIDLRRCERLPWVRHWILEAKQPPAPISWWKYKRGTETHIVIFNEEEKFVVILAERNGYYLLKSAYVVRTRRAEQLKKERDEYWD